MSYVGENNYFSFRDGGCEEKNGHAIDSSGAAYLGRVLSGIFSRFSIGCCGFENLPLMYSLCGGISECGKKHYRHTENRTEHCAECCADDKQRSNLAALIAC